VFFEFLLILEPAFGDDDILDALKPILMLLNQPIVMSLNQPIVMSLN
jgi:hypothetical protein